MSINQSFAVAMQAISVISFSAPEAVSAKFISEQISIHPVVIRRVLTKLVTSQILNSIQGANGGYSLTRAAHKISLQNIYIAVQQQGVFVSNNAVPKANCQDGLLIESVLENVYEQADMAIEKIFNNISLEDILSKAKQKT